MLMVSAPPAADVFQLTPSTESSQFNTVLGEFRDLARVLLAPSATATA